MTLGSTHQGKADRGAASVLAVGAEQRRVQQRLHSGCLLDTSITGSQSPGRTWPISRTLLLTPSFIKGLGLWRRGERGEDQIGREDRRYWPGLRRRRHTFSQSHILEVVFKVRHKYNQVGEHTIPHKYVLAKPHFNIPVDFYTCSKRWWCRVLELQRPEGKAVGSTIHGCNDSNRCGGQQTCNYQTESSFCDRSNNRSEGRLELEGARHGAKREENVK